MTKTQQVLVGLMAAFEKTSGVNPYRATGLLGNRLVDILERAPSGEDAAGQIVSQIRKYPRTLRRAAEMPGMASDLPRRVDGILAGEGLKPGEIETLNEVKSHIVERPEYPDLMRKEIAGKIQREQASRTKTSMHGYPDYQMTDPITAPLPQSSFPEEEVKPKGLLSKIPGRAIGAGGMIGGFMGKGLVDEDLRRADQTINFLKGKPSPQLNTRLLQAVQSGDLTPEALPLARKNFASPEWLKNEYFANPDLYDATLKAERGKYWGAMGKGPGLGMLGGALAGLGGGLLYNHLKESSLRGLLWKEARPSFMAPPPESQEIPTAWRNHLSFKHQPSAFAATQVGASPFEQTRMSEAPMAHTVAARMGRPAPQAAEGLLSKLRNAGATTVGKIHR